MKEPNEALAPEAPPGTPEANLSGPAKPEKSPLLREVRSLAVRLAVFPAVKDGDLVLGIRLEKDYAKNDVVVYERSGTLRVGRVLARGGDIVTLSESGVVEVNGSAQGGGILYPTYPKSLLSYPYAVPEDSVFILGDCRTQAEDSRDFGPVQCSAVKAKVITLIRRRGL